MTMTLAEAARDIEIALDIAHTNTATFFADAARHSLKRFNLSRHTLVFQRDTLVIKCDNYNARRWWELGPSRLPHAPDSLFRAIADIGAIIDETLPTEVVNKLDGIIL